MERINQFLDELYKESSLSLREKEEMKEEMRTHLLEHIEEAKSKGLTEDEAVSEALEQFGGEADIFEAGTKHKKSKLKDKWFIATLVLFCLSFILVGFAWGVEKVNEQQRQYFYNNIEGALFFGNKPIVETLETDVNRAIENGTIKNIVITIGTHPSSHVLFKTIGTEGFPQDDSAFIETIEERIPMIHPNTEDTYLVTSSYNVVRFYWVIQLASVFFISSLILYSYRLLKTSKDCD
ncbi:permease prefix domain 1-containing protein [Bacillus sp. EB01]|uniref:permease prefix domain 1-containing protein n=1 Tax=Bacillus sp. EB01 TaxID=1347086 RepID=UPI000694D0C5|nr:permease prefix domain 1-containing protein [Bacillus sp. EB01]